MGALAGPALYLLRGQLVRKLDALLAGCACSRSPALASGCSPWHWGSWLVAPCKCQGQLSLWMSWPCEAGLAQVK